MVKHLLLFSEERGRFPYQTRNKPFEKESFVPNLTVPQSEVGN